MQPQLWGGVECTINRVRSRYINQIVKVGHHNRLTDLDHFLSLGVRTLRHPVLWEWINEHGWTWADASLHRLRDLAIEPVIGLLHHGSGPKHTSLIDPQFPLKFAAYAGDVAQRFPWVRAYTPINEPLTTARFSGLYGHWYPHLQDDTSFVTCLLNQLQGIVLAIKAIRRINPAAVLIQTEDLGNTFSTEELAYQAEFERLRRWITFDLLCGKVDSSHGLFEYLRHAGASENQLEFFCEQPCTPDVLGVNYYLTSDRYLDHRIENYPAHTIGGNGKHRYADVEAIRASSTGLAGAEQLLTEVWARYGRPVAITEVHNGAGVHDQIRWFAEMWHGAIRAQRAGVDVMGVTAWALLGSFDWDSLVTQEQGRFECGPICAHLGEIRETDLADVLRQAASGNDLSHAALRTPGWWHSSARLIYEREFEAVEAA